MIDYSLPVTDLHRHLDGNIKPETIWHLSERFGLKRPAASLQALRQKAQIQGQTSDLMAFLQRLDLGVSVLVNQDACYHVAYENMRDAAHGKLDYVELRFSPYYMAQPHCLAMESVIEAVVDGVKDGARDFNVSANLIGILSRTFGPDQCMAELKALTAFPEAFVALDLAGDEKGFPAALFTQHFTKARDIGWQVTVHAGEASGPDSIWQAITQLGASRIGHACAAVQDIKLMEYMRCHNIVIESCPTSNYHTATISRLSEHPLPVFLQHDLMVTLNTDDPGVSNIDLAHEYAVAHQELNVSAAQLATIQNNGLRAAFLSPEQKQAILQQKHS